MTLKKSVVVGSAATVMLVAALSFYNAGRAGSVSLTPEAQFRHGQRAYRPLPVTPIADVASRSGGSWEAAAAELRAMMEASEVSGGDVLAAAGVVLSSEQIADLRRAAADLLAVRFLQDDPGVYIAWMLDHGYRFKTVDEWQPWGGLSPVYRVFTGRPLADGRGVDEAFRDVWEVSLRSGRAAGGRPVALAAPPAGVHIALGTGSFNREFTGRVESATHLDFAEWHGGGVGTCPTWFIAERSRDMLVREHGEVVAARVALVADFAHGDRHPFSTQWFLDPVDGQWRLWTVNVNNFRYGREDFCVPY